MELEIKIHDRLAKVNLVSRNKNIVTLKVDDKLYELDMVKVEEHEYSILYRGQSYSIEMVEGGKPKQFIANTPTSSYQLEIVDAEARYLMNRSKGDADLSANIISTPMPGKVVKILVKEGDTLAAGQTVIIVSAMKMESEYKVLRACVVKKVLVADGDIVKSNEPLIFIE